MLKVAVLEQARGAASLAQYIRREVPVIEVVGVRCTEEDVLTVEAVERKVGPYVGKAKVIVLGSYRMTEVALVYLKAKYPRQRWLGMRMKLSRRMQKWETGEKVLVLMHGRVAAGRLYAGERVRLTSGLEVLEPKWAGKEVLDLETLWRGLQVTGKVKRVLLYRTDWNEWRGTLERMMGWDVRVMDELADMCREVCYILGLKGVVTGDG